MYPDSPTRRVGGEPIKAFVRHEHIARLYSLDKSVTDEELRRFSPACPRSRAGRRNIRWNINSTG